MCGHLYIKKSKFNCKPIKIFVRDLLSQRRKYNCMPLFHLFPLSKFFFLLLLPFVHWIRWSVGMGTADKAATDSRSLVSVNTSRQSKSKTRAGCKQHISAQNPIQGDWKVSLNSWLIKYKQRLKLGISAFLHVAVRNRRSQWRGNFKVPDNENGRDIWQYGEKLPSYI